MQPYQSASEEIQRQGELPLEYLKGAASIAGSVGTAAAGGLALKKVLPFLSKYIPQDLAIKGLSKIDPRFGKFINSSLQAGQSFDDVKNFIREKATGSKEEQAPEQQNIIKQYSDDLNQFLEQHIKSGRNPIEAGALAQLDPKYKKIISKLEQDHKTPFSSILASIYGGEDQSQPQQAQPQQNQVQGQGMQALMQALNMAAESRKRRAQ